MHARDLAQLAARLVLESTDPPTAADTTVELAKQYWTASKCRLESWQRALRIFAADLQADDPWHNPWPATEVVIQEILISEILTRVWTAVLIHRDASTSSNELSGVAHSVFISHMEVSNQALRLLMAQDDNRLAAVQTLNTQRRRWERWTDLLLGCLPEDEIARRFAHNRDRMLDFARDRRHQSPAARHQADQLLLASLTAELRKSSQRLSANPELNRQIAAGVMAFLPAEQFDSTGLPKPEHQIRMEQTLAETDGFIREFQRHYLPEPLDAAPGRGVFSPPDPGR
jgi:hypothetical protein